jgi:hypothetical protein
MYKFRFAFRAFVSVGFFFAFFVVTAQAQATRTWVSGTGDNNNPCSRTAPCKGIAIALSKTNVGGEVNCLDPLAEQGVVSITKSITIDCEDTQGTLLAVVLTGIDINITDPADTAKNVRLRGLTMSGDGSGMSGIRVRSGNRLTLEEVVVDNFAMHGVSIETTSGAFSLVLKNTTIRNSALNGVNTFLTGTATATVFMMDSTLASNGIGFNQGAATASVIQNSAITGNTTGLQASGSTSILGMKGCVVSHNGTGVSALSSANIRIGGNLITANTTGLSGASILSWGGNIIDGNSANGTNNGAALLQ